jgi:LmbE family N-acetylglucosaminyl deacetylase
LPPWACLRPQTTPMAEMTSGTFRFGARPIADGGTPVETWTEWDHPLPPLNLHDCPGITVIAPHPDDETLGLGATIATLCNAGVDVQVVSVSDGGAAYPGLTDSARAELEDVRRAELRRSLHVLGAGDPIALGMPDGELSQHEQRLTSRIVQLLSVFPTGRWCAATWRGDGHPDHEAVGRAAAAAAARTQAVLIEYPVWMWHWAMPGDPVVPWNRARRIELTDEALNVKAIAAESFSSQTRPTPDREAVLPPAVLQRLLTIGEMVFV